MKHGDKKKIADSLGVSKTFIYEYFKGNRGMSWKTANLAAKLFPTVSATEWMDRDVEAIKGKIKI